MPPCLETWKKSAWIGLQTVCRLDTRAGSAQTEEGVIKKHDKGATARTAGNRGDLVGLSQGFKPI